MRRPSFTEVLQPITQPTEIVLGLPEVDPAAPTHRYNPEFLRFLRRAGAVVVLTGIVVVVPMFAIRFVPGVIFGFLLVSGGWSVISLELLLSPDVDPWDRRVQEWVRRKVGRR